MKKNKQKEKEKSKKIEIVAEEPDSIEFENKKYYLSGNFTEPKKDIGEKLESLGAIHVTSFAVKNTDYFVLAEKGVKHLGKQKPHGDKAESIQEHNNEKDQKRHIPIIKEEHCKKLIDQALKQPPKP